MHADAPCGLVFLQVRVPLDDIAPLIRKLVDAAVSWEDVAAKYPLVQKSGDDAADQQ